MGAIGLLATAITANARECPGFPDHLCVPLGLVMVQAQTQGSDAVKKQRGVDNHVTRRAGTTRVANRRTRKNRRSK